MEKEQAYIRSVISGITKDTPYQPNEIYELDIDYVPEEYKELFMSWVKKYDEEAEQLPDTNYANIKDLFDGKDMMFLDKDREFVRITADQILKNVQPNSNKLTMLMDIREKLPKRGKTNKLIKEWEKLDDVIAKEMYIEANKNMDPSTLEHIRKNFQGYNYKRLFIARCKKYLRFNYNRRPKQKVSCLTTSNYMSEKDKDNLTNDEKIAVGLMDEYEKH